MSKFTAGPWEARGTDVRSVKDERIVAIADLLPPGSRNLSGAENLAIAQANAQLIAAAPELLEALKEVTKRLNTYLERPRESDVLRRAKAVIARAEGK